MWQRCVKVNLRITATRSVPIPWGCGMNHCAGCQVSCNSSGFWSARSRRKQETPQWRFRARWLAYVPRFIFMVSCIVNSILTFRHRASSIQDRRFTTLQRTLFVYLIFRHRASCILRQVFHYSPENAFYIFKQQIYFIIWYLLDRASLI